MNTKFSRYALGGLLSSSSLFWGSMLQAEPFAYVETLSMAQELEEGERGTFLQFMEAEVKPAIDRLATEGYSLCSSTEIAEAYEASDRKVKSKVDRSFGGLSEVQSIVRALRQNLGDRTITAEALPSAIRAVAPGVDSYDLATFIGLACGGGVRVDFAPENYALNVHYDVSEQRSGRSFGVGPTRGANDASDKQYLDDLEEYSRANPEDLADFQRALFNSLLMRDGTGFRRITPFGQTVLTDFLAVYTAEQARNLMDGEVSPHWDAALLEVTLLASFHAGQTEMQLYYRNPATGETTLTSTTFRQKPCAVPNQSKSASLNDYWQFSRNIEDPANCRRSGINITKGEFRKLGAAITSYMKSNYPELTVAVTESMGISANSRNVFQGLSGYLIGESAPRTLPMRDAQAITKAWVDFLAVVTSDADAITESLQE